MELLIIIILPCNYSIASTKYFSCSMNTYTYDIHRYIRAIGIDGFRQHRKPREHACLCASSYAKKRSRKCFTSLFKVPSSRRGRCQWDRDVVPESRTMIVTLWERWWYLGEKTGLHFGQNAFDGLPHRGGTSGVCTAKELSQFKRKYGLRKPLHLSLSLPLSNFRF